MYKYQKFCVGIKCFKNTSFCIMKKVLKSKILNSKMYSILRQATLQRGEKIIKKELKNTENSDNHFTCEQIETPVIFLRPINCFMYNENY